MPSYLELYLIVLSYKFLLAGFSNSNMIPPQSQVAVFSLVIFRSNQQFSFSASLEKMTLWDKQSV